MNELPVYIVNAFADRMQAGNPAAVVPLEGPDWPSAGMLQEIASENNLSETAYVTQRGNGYELRWFTPTTEVDLCGHATLAAAHVYYTERHYNAPEIVFHTRSGPLRVRKAAGNRLAMDFPVVPTEAVAAPALLREALGVDIVDCRAGMDYLVVVRNAGVVSDLRPDLKLIERLERRGVIVTAASGGDDKETDFVSRFFGPRAGIPEDPVTGSAHCALAPYWAQKLGKNVLQARQLSRRGGHLECEVAGSRVILRGKAHTYLRGTLRVSSS